MADNFVTEQVFNLTVEGLRRDIESNRRLSEATVEKASEIDRVIEMFRGLARSVDTLRDEQKWALRFLIAQLAALVLMFAKFYMG